MAPNEYKKRRDYPSIISPDPDTLPDYVGPDDTGLEDDFVEPDEVAPKNQYPLDRIDPHFTNRKFPKANHSYPLNHRLVKRETWDWKRTLPDGTAYKEQLKIRRGNGWL